MNNISSIKSLEIKESFHLSEEFKNMISSSGYSQDLKDFILNQDFRKNITKDKVKKIYAEFDPNSIKAYWTISLNDLAILLKSIFNVNSSFLNKKTNFIDSTNLLFDNINAYIEKLFSEYFKEEFESIKSEVLENVLWVLKK